MNFLKKSIGMDDLIIAMKSFQIVTVMGSQDIRQRYKRSKLGPFWITISMAVMITTIGLVFGNLFKIDTKEFIPFLAMGLIVWSFMLSSVTDGCDAFISSEGIIKQLPVPLYVHVFRAIWKNLLIFAHNIVIFPLVLLAVGKGITWYVFWAIPGLFLLILNLAWVLMLLAMVCARFRDMTQIVLSIMQVAFYITPIIWMPQIMSHRVGDLLVNLNPLYHLIDIVRGPLLGQPPIMSSYCVAIIMAIVGFIVSIKLTTKYKRRVPYWV